MKKIAAFVVVLALVVAGGAWWLNQNMDGLIKDAGGKKLIVEDLSVTGAKAEASAAFMNGKTVGVGLPDIALKNLGKSKGGVTPGELGQEIAGAIKARLTGALSFDNLMKSMGGALDKAGSAIKGLFK